MEANINCITSNCTFNNLRICLTKFRKFFCIEILMIFFLTPQCLLLVAEQNLSLEKACRVNLNISDEICDNMMHKGNTNINCKHIGELLNTSDFSNLDELIIKIKDTNITLNAVKVCNAESSSQLLETEIKFITSLFEYITIAVLVAAVTWSDRKGLRTGCMLLPLIGYLCSHIAIFMKQFPMEFNSILGLLFIAVSGGSTLMNAGVHSYITAMFPEEERLRRFITYAASLTAVAVIVNSFAGNLFRKIGYINTILICIPFDVIGILYIIYGIEEIPAPSNTIQYNVDTNSNTSSTDHTNNIPISDIEEAAHNDIEEEADNDIVEEADNIVEEADNVVEETNNVVEETNNVEEITNDTLMQTSTTSVLIQCFDVFQIQKRSSSQWLIIATILILYMLTLIPLYGESANEYKFARTQLNWNEIDQTHYLSYTNTLYLVGNFIYLAYNSLSRKTSGHQHISEALIACFSSILSVLSRFVFVHTTTTSMMYYARALDMFVLIRAVTIKNMLSNIVTANEWGKTFAACGVIEGISKHIGISLYSKIYTETKDSILNSAFYCFSFALLSISIVLFAGLHFKLYGRNQQRERYAVQARIERESIENRESISIENNDSVSLNQNQQMPNEETNRTFRRGNRQVIHAVDVPIVHATTAQLEALRKKHYESMSHNENQQLPTINEEINRTFRRGNRQVIYAVDVPIVHATTAQLEALRKKHYESMSHNENQQLPTINE